MGELASKIRAKYPGAYDSLPDGELESKIIAKYPGVYDHLAGGTDKPAAPQQTPQEYTKQLVNDPKYRAGMAQFIRSQGKRDLKQEAVRRLPLAGRVADAALGKYADPVYAERTVDETLGPQVSPTTGGAMLSGINRVINNPDKSLTNLAYAMPELAKGAYSAATSPEQGSVGRFVGENVKGMLAPTGLVDLAKGNMDMPAAREAWENDALGSGLMAFGGMAAKKSLRDLASAGVEKVGLTPEKLYASSIKQSTVIPMAQRAANVKAGLEGGYVPNKKGLGRLYDNINDLNSQIGQKIKESTQGGKMINVEDIVSRLDDVKQRAIDSFGDNNNVLAKIDDFAASLRDHPSVVNGQIPVDVAQTMKVNTYKQLKNAYGELKGFEVEAKKAMARGAKEEIVNQIPELAELNAKDSTLINLEKVLFKAVNRIENRDMVGIGVPIKMATGAMGGPKGAIVGALVGLIDTPAIKANLAIAMHKARGRAVPKAELNNRLGAIKATLQSKLDELRKAGAVPKLQEEYGAIKGDASNLPAVRPAIEGEYIPPVRTQDFRPQRQPATVDMERPVAGLLPNRQKQLPSSRTFIAGERGGVYDPSAMKQSGMTPREIAAARRRIKGRKGQ